MPLFLGASDLVLTERGVSKTRDQGLDRGRVGVYLFLKNAVLGLGLGLTLTLP